MLPRLIILILLFPMMANAATPFHLGTCVADSWDSAAAPDKVRDICLQAEASTFVLKTIDTRRPQIYASAKTYAGVHYGANQSLHLQFEGARVKPLASGDKEQIYRYPPTILLRQGNVATDAIALSAGTFPAPFGLNQNFLAGFYVPFNPRSFWPEAKPGVMLTLDNHVETTLNFAVNYDPARNESRLTARYAFDLSALGGTRVVNSCTFAELGQRSYGTGLVNYSRTKAIFMIEWIHTATTPDGQQDPFAQLIRLAYQAAPQKNRSTIVIYDDVRLQYRLFTVAQQIHHRSWLLSNLGISYRKDETHQIGNRWFITAGAKFHL